jgi:hypothetical protein
MPTRSSSLALVAVALGLAACAPGIRTVPTNDGAFIYGFFAVPEKVGTANCVGIIQAEKVGIAGRAGCMATSPEGLFFIENVPPMKYNVHGFYIDLAFNSLGDMAKPFPVKAGSMHYYGAYRYEKVSDSGIGRAGKFRLTPTSHPSHAEVLKKLLVQESIGPRWKKRIQARLRELGGE